MTGDNGQLQSPSLTARSPLLNELPLFATHPPGPNIFWFQENMDIQEKVNMLAMLEVATPKVLAHYQPLPSGTA